MKEKNKNCEECGAFNPLKYDFAGDPVSGNCAYSGEYVVANQICKMRLNEKEKNLDDCASCKIG